MLQSKKDLIDYLNSDNNFLKPTTIRGKLLFWYAHEPSAQIRKYLVFLRKFEYYHNTAKGNKLIILLSMYYERRKNLMGSKLGIEIGPNCFGKGLSIWHHGSIVVNNDARIGENCTLHGCNCIGNNGQSQATPRIGNNVDIGHGAVIIGDVEIADNVKIGANAVVNKSVSKPGSVVVGIPARVINNP